MELVNYLELEIPVEESKVKLELSEIFDMIFGDVIPGDILPDDNIDQELILRLSKYFDSEQYAYLVLMIGQINIWNRINISTNNGIDFKYK